MIIVNKGSDLASYKVKSGGIAGFDYVNKSDLKNRFGKLDCAIVVGKHGFVTFTKTTSEKTKVQSINKTWLKELTEEQ